MRVNHSGMSTRLMSAKQDRFTVNEKAEVGLVSTLLKVDAWASSIHGPSVVPPGSTACDVIEQLAQAFIADATGIERQLLLKSLLEAFFYCVGLDTDITAGEITVRLKRFVDRRGKSAFLQQFLSLYFFNYVWLDGSGSGREQTEALEEFEHSMKDVERMCRKAVIAACAPEGVMDRPTAETLIHNIQAGLMKLAE